MFKVFKTQAMLAKAAVIVEEAFEACEYPGHFQKPGAMAAHIVNSSWKEATRHIDSGLPSPEVLALFSVSVWASLTGNEAKETESAESAYMSGFLIDTADHIERKYRIDFGFPKNNADTALTQTSSVMRLGRKGLSD